MSERVALPSDGLTAFFERCQVTELALFGSALRDDFAPDSDVGVPVSFEPRVPHTLLDIVRMQEGLSGMFGRKVDLNRAHRSRAEPELHPPQSDSSARRDDLRGMTTPGCSACCWQRAKRWRPSMGGGWD